MLLGHAGIVALPSPALLLLLALLAAAPSLPLDVEAPPQLAGTAREIERMDRAALLAGLEMAGLTDPAGPLRVVLLPEESEEARRIPEWIAGYTDGLSGTVTLLPARAAAYPHDGLKELLAHELAHVFIARAARGRAVPRWFHEGVALFAGRPWGLEDRAVVSWAVLSRDRPALASLSERFQGTRGEVRQAYALSGAFLRHAMSRYGPRLPARILGRMAEGLPFEEAFRRVTGDQLRDAEASFWRAETSFDRWIPILTSTAALWGAMTLLFLWVVKRRKRRDAEIRAAWEAEERPPDDVAPL